MYTWLHGGIYELDPEGLSNCGLVLPDPQP